jgi:putative two-component system response regulator
MTPGTIVCVDDDANVLSSLRDVLCNNLGQGVDVEFAESGEEALDICDDLKADGRPMSVIISDYIMPKMRGDDLLIAIHERSPETVTIMLTGQSDMVGVQRAINQAALYRFIEKPFINEDLLLTVRTALAAYNQERAIHAQNAYLKKANEELANLSRELSDTRDVTILAMASLAESRDSDTGNHIRRTQHYIKVLADKLKTHPRFKPHLDEKSIDLLFKSAPLHDIGKVGIPDRILLKPGKLTFDEFEIMKTHAAIGMEVIAAAEKNMGMEIEFLRFAKEIAYNHHEKWDGSGYPRGLSGDAIPVSARLMALADVYDALISRRVYKEGMSHSQAMAIIMEGRGKHFDPDVVDAAFNLEEELQAIARRYMDSDEELHAKAKQLELKV